MPINLKAIKKGHVYTVPETARLLGKGGQAVRLYIKTGKLKGTKGDDKRWRIEGSEIHRFISGVQGD